MRTLFELFRLLLENFSISLHPIKNEILILLQTVTYTLIATVVILLPAILAMAFRPLFTKKRRFPNTHIGASKAMKDKGIGCAVSFDREVRNKTR